MKTFKQLITEGRDAPLYHGTYMHFAPQILDTNKLVGSRRGEIHPKRGMPDLARGVSLTRSIRSALDWKPNGIVFELDQTKLTKNYRLIPANAFHYFTPLEYAAGIHAKHEELFEERVDGDILQLDRYLTKVITSELSKESLSRMLDRFFKHDLIDILVEHPLLYCWKTRKFLNK